MHSEFRAHHPHCTCNIWTMRIFRALQEIMQGGAQFEPRHVPTCSAAPFSPSITKRLQYYPSPLPVNICLLVCWLLIIVTCTFCRLNLMSKLLLLICKLLPLSLHVALHVEHPLQ